jgi:undecaprenyl-diphosphatase
MRPSELALALALVAGPAELLPVSSSAHVALLGGDEVGLHAGPLAALLIGRRAEAAEALRRLDARRAAMHLLAGGIPAAVGALLGHRRPAGRRAIAGGLLAGAALLAFADRSDGARSRWDAGPADGAWLGLAQAAALWPGVSRNGATLAAARLRGFAREEANALSREVGVPVTAGALAWSRSAPAPLPAAASFASALAALPAVRLVDRGPLWPWAAYRAGVALALLRESRR